MYTVLFLIVVCVTCLFYILYMFYLFLSAYIYLSANNVIDNSAAKIFCFVGLKHTIPHREPSKNTDRPYKSAQADLEHC